MKTKEQKSQVIKDLSKKIPEADVVIFTSFSREGEKGLSVGQMRKLKKNMKDVGAEYIVAKKNLIGISVEHSGMSKLLDAKELKGSLGLVLGKKEGDSIALSKNVYDFAKANPALRIFGAVLEKKYLDADRFVEFAKLSSKEALIARLFGMMQYPIRNLLLVLNNIYPVKSGEAGTATQ